ncbi:MAG: M23 family metallopeptidase [Bacilli bacterium]|nr:M23 family metallopeptidase [Bacilli bacterium]
MKKKLYLKTWVLTTGIVAIIIGVITITSIVSENIFSNMGVDNNSYVLRGLVNSYTPVNTEIDKTSMRPFTDESVTINTNYYDSKKSKEEQEKSLILYEKTYMPNTGILYSNDKPFDVVAIYEGEIISITEDDVFGNIVEIKHTNNMTSKYSSIDNIEVSVGETVNKGEVIGTSGKNKVVSVSENMLLFELLYNGTNVNPEEYYDRNLDEMR